MRLRDTLERLFWTFVAGFLGSLVGAPALVNVIEATADVDLDLGVWQTALVSATFAGLTAVTNFLLLFARYRLSVLPNPGDGLPGLPTPPTVEVAPLVNQ